MHEHEKGRLNTFQQTMVHWDDLHPYNAVHSVKIFGQLNFERLNCVINTSLERHGLTNLMLDHSEGTYHYLGGPAQHGVKPLANEGELLPEIERQLNTRFIRDKVFEPFRFFVAPGQDSFWLGVAYFHPIADAESIVRLLKELVENYSSDEPVRVGHFARYQDDQNVAPVRVLTKKLWALPSLAINLRRSCRPAYRDSLNLQNGFLYFSMSSGCLAALKDTAKTWQVTINDLFLGLLLKSLMPLAEKRISGKRTRLSVGCVVNSRSALSLNSKDAFGLFLGSFIVSCELAAGGTCMKPNSSLMQLSKHVQQQTKAVKEAKLYLGAPLEMRFGQLMLPFFSLERRKRLYQKHYPLWGGITNLNLNSLWPAIEQHRIDYFRAVSTGPVTPLVVSLTSVGNRLNVGVTFRSTVFSTQDVENVQGCFQNEIGRLNAEAAEPE